jgi:hypothetical protein
VDLLDRGQELVEVGRLLDVAGGAAADRPHAVGLVLVHGQDDGLGRHRQAGHLGQGLHAVLLRHRDVEEEDVGLQARDRLQGLGAGRGLADHFDAGALAVSILASASRISVWSSARTTRIMGYSAQIGICEAQGTT